MTDSRPNLTVVGTDKHDLMIRRMETSGHAADLLRSLLREIESGIISPDKMVVVYDIPAPSGSHMTPDVRIAMGSNVVDPEAYWLLSRIQTRMLLVENALSAPEED